MMSCTDGICAWYRWHLYRERSATFLATNGIYCCSLSHLQRFIWRNALYPALRAGLTYCAPCFASSSCLRFSFPLRFAQRTLFQRLPYGLYHCLCSIASTRLTSQISLDRTLVWAGIRCKNLKNIHSIRILYVYFFLSLHKIGCARPSKTELLWHLLALSLHKIDPATPDESIG